MLDPVLLTYFAKGARLIAWSIVGEYAPHRDAQARIAGQRRFQESRRRNSLFVRSDLEKAMRE